jgi:hypothetical protein
MMLLATSSSCFVSFFVSVYVRVLFLSSGPRRFFIYSKILLSAGNLWHIGVITRESTIHVDRGISSSTFLAAVVELGVHVITVLGTRTSASFAMFVSDPTLPRASRDVACRIAWADERVRLQARDVGHGKDLLRRLGCRVYKSDNSNLKQWAQLVDKFEPVQQLMDAKMQAWGAMDMDALLKDLDKTFSLKDARAGALDFLGLPQSGRARNQLLRLADALKSTNVVHKPFVIRTHPSYPNYIYTRKFTFHGRQVCIAAVREHVTSKDIQVLEFFITNPALIAHAGDLVFDTLPLSTFQNHAFAPSKTRHTIDTASLARLERQVRVAEVVRCVFLFARG